MFTLSFLKPLAKKHPAIARGIEGLIHQTLALGIAYLIGSFIGEYEFSKEIFIQVISAPTLLFLAKFKRDLQKSAKK